MKLSILLVCITLLFSCTSSRYIAQPQPLQTENLPVPDTEVEIENIGSCTDSEDRTLKFNANYPLTVLVHGCNGSAGRFRSLAQLYAFHGQQAVCYSYDDRDRLTKSADKLVTALNKLVSVSSNENITVIGHSMGGLIARKAMENKRLNSELNINLITVSAPLAGIAAASTCALRPLHWLSLGIVPAVCWGITGDNWYEITSQSDFIKYPAPLSSSVLRYLKIVTNEQNTCRRIDSEGNCVESDYVFELDEQYQPVIDGYRQVTNIQVDAGHVEIVGYKDVEPRKLLTILQQENMISGTPVERQAELELLLSQLY
ncbi:MAG: hypothetical protein ACJAT7_001145 [Psychromonas sp.]|jgi:hypothetical protein|uniref:esterase/lipase family protein n=1 Tax=Psychromonas sp. TaxID=1884585 RepID=UPI0039E3AAE9